MKKICAWCGKVMNNKTGDDTRISHGMCEDCRVIWEADAKAFLGKQMGADAPTSAPETRNRLGAKSRFHEIPIPASLICQTEKRRKKWTDFSEFSKKRRAVFCGSLPARFSGTCG